MTSLFGGYRFAGALLALLFPLLGWGMNELSVEPYQANDWAKGMNLPARAVIPLREGELAGVCELFSKVDALRVRMARRARANAYWLELSGEGESVPSDAALRFELVWQGRRYAFDRWGRFAVDGRFVRPADAELLARFSTFYKNHLAETVFRDFPATRPESRPTPSATTLPVFAGFEDDRYQKHDALVLRLVAEFNADRAAGVGAAPGTRLNIPELNPALIKALMIEESGGNGPRSQEAWECDPLQVNVPGDWSEAKAELGLKKPEARNEGTLEDNLRAGIRYLARKGFGLSGRAIAHRPDAYFDSWRTALQRYNGRSDTVADGRRYRVAYADRILRRAEHPSLFVPIAIERHP